jgi:signal transduction histidine kinase/ActR/RegA family two-component response regulator
MTIPALRSRLTHAALLTTAAALLLDAVLVIGFEFQRFRTEAVDNLHTQQGILARAVSPSLVFNDPDAAAQQLASLAENPRVRVAEVFGAGGRPFARYASSRDDAAKMPASNPLPGLGSNFDGDDVEIAYDIFHDGERIGTLYMRGRSDVARRLAGYAFIQALVMAVSLALALSVFGRVQRRITQPIARVAAVAQEVVERRDWRLRAPSADTREIAALVDAFNRMLAEMAESSTQLRQEIGERERAEAGLRAADRRKDEFLATLAHELRNPLAPMLNAVALMRRGDAMPAVRDKAIAILERQLRHVVRLIDDLLDVSRITTGKLSLHMEIADLHAVIRPTMELAETTARDRQLQLTSAVPEAPCWVVGDTARLQQVFSNLLGNACRYTPPGGRVEVAARCEDGFAVVEVVDTGVGIDPQMQERVFELFEQGDKSLERGNAGLGIGLTLARQLVLLHGGTIAVFSRGIGHGATFRVRLPMTAERPAPALPARAAGDGASVAGRRVLLADDNVDFAASLQTALEAAGMAVTAVHDGRAALALARAQPFDAAVLDIGMPAMNGYELAGALRAEPATAQLVLFAVSGWGQASDKERAAAAGFDRHFVKPVPPGVLIEALGDALGTERT